ncbi:MAG: protein translocase subunit SecF [Lautropia mirabilis]|jgi:protein-export membrane protein, secD/secF family|nr:protein translocase subunit SecF [Lautropia mirabilis]
MELFKIRRDIPFMRHVTILNAISIVFFLLAVLFLFTRGLNLSVEFTGGTVMEFSYAQPADLGKTRQAIEEMGFSEPQVQNFGTSRDVLIRLPLKEGVSAAKQAEQVLAALKQHDPSVELRRNEFVGPQVGQELATSGAMALLVVIAGIVIYLAARFEWKFGVAGIIANLHDVVIILGFFAFFQWEFSLSVLAAVLAVLGYSVNESVIIFDRVREKFRERHARNMTTAQVLDHAITTTTSRTVITHTSTLMMVLSMLFFGGPTLHYFSLALAIGICFGVYSSIFVAAAIVMRLGLKREDLVKPVKKKDATEVELP